MYKINHLWKTWSWWRMEDECTFFLGTWGATQNKHARNAHPELRRDSEGPPVEQLRNGDSSGKWWKKCNIPQTLNWIPWIKVGWWKKLKWNSDKRIEDNSESGGLTSWIPYLAGAIVTQAFQLLADVGEPGWRELWNKALSGWCFDIKTHTFSHKNT